MAVIVGSARSDENGKAYGGAAGDQTGKEVSTQNWYLHSKGWRVFRAKDDIKAERIAVAMQAACDNPQIGYDQYQRNSLYNDVAANGYNPAKTTKPVETDCSALVRTCCAYAGIIGLPSDFRTVNMPINLMATKQFIELTDTKYTTKSDYLKRGDILVTKTSGHTVVVLSNGSKSNVAVVENGKTKTDDYPTIRKGSKGEAVKRLQSILIHDGYSCGKSGVDGDFGTATQSAVKGFQIDHYLEVDGIVGPKTWAALTPVEESVAVVKAGAWNVRDKGDVSGRAIGIISAGTQVKLTGITTDTFVQIAWNGGTAWVSKKAFE